MIADRTGVRSLTNDSQIRDGADQLHPYNEPMEKP